MNPLTVLPPKVRLYIYLVVFVAGLVVAAVQAAGGDWFQAVALLIGSLTSALAGSNVDTAETDEA